MHASFKVPPYCDIHVSCSQEEQAAAELALSRAQLFPLKKENARLLKDNNLLHLKASRTGGQRAGNACRVIL